MITHLNSSLPWPAKAKAHQDRGGCPVAETDVFMVDLGLMSVAALVHQAPEGGFWAEVPKLPGCVTEGETLDEVKANLIEAVEAWLEASQDAG